MHRWPVIAFSWQLAWTSLQNNCNKHPTGKHKLEIWLRPSYFYWMTRTNEPGDFLTENNIACCWRILIVFNENFSSIKTRYDIYQKGGCLKNDGLGGDRMLDADRQTDNYISSHREHPKKYRHTPMFRSHNAFVEICRSMTWGNGRLCDNTIYFLTTKEFHPVNIVETTM